MSSLIASIFDLYIQLYQPHAFRALVAAISIRVKYVPPKLFYNRPQRAENFSVGGDVEERGSEIYLLATRLAVLSITADTF